MFFQLLRTSELSNRDTWVIDNHDTFAVGELDYYSLTRLYYLVWFPNPTASEVDSCKLFGVRRVYQVIPVVQVQHQFPMSHSRSGRWTRLSLELWNCRICKAGLF